MLGTDGSSFTRSRQESEASRMADDMDSRAVLEALARLENMIDDEKKQKVNLEKKFDGLYNQRDRNFREKSQPPAAGAGSPQRQPLGQLDQMAEEIMELVQKRNELADSENIFSVLKKNNTQVNDFKNSIFSQLGVGAGVKQVDLFKRGSSRKTVQFNGEGLQEILKRFSLIEPPNKSRELNKILNQGQPEEEEETEKKPKMTKNQAFQKRLQEYEEKKLKNHQELVNEKARQDELDRFGWFHPEVNPKSEKLVARTRKSSKSPQIHKRLHEVIKEREEYLMTLRKQREQFEKENLDANCTFQPKITPFSPEEKPGAIRQSNLLLREDRGDDSFIRKQEEYERRSRVHQKLLRDRQFQEEMRNLKSKPSISPTSKVLAQKSRSYLRINEKLYEEAFNKEKKQKQLEKEYMKELYPFKPNIKGPGQPKTEAKSKDMSKLEAALTKVDSLLQHELSPDGLNFTQFSNRQTPSKSILKTPGKTQQPPNRHSTPTPTKKKVYFRDRATKRFVSTVKTAHDSFVDDDGSVNILFDKRAVEEIRKHLR